jgi:hypothetical protein
MPGWKTVVTPPRRTFGFICHPVSVTARLLDEEGGISDADEDTRVVVRVPLGTLVPESPLVVRRDSFSTAARLIALGSGQGDVTAEADGLSAVSGRVEFVFPWTPLFLAMLGGASGAGCRSGLRRRADSVPVALQGFVFGIVVYGLAAFLPADRLPDAARAMAALPVTSGLGAAVLGVVGGYCGKQLLGESQSERPAVMPA